ncbi:MAG: hypothetical protein ACX936_21110 [Marinobacter sp.]
MHEDRAEEREPESQRKEVGPVGTEESASEEPEFQWELVEQGGSERHNNQPRKG